MKNFIIVIILIVIVIIVLASCSLMNNNTNDQVVQATPTQPVGVMIELIVQADDTAVYDTVGQVVTYYYTVTNTGTGSTPGPVTTVGTTLTCPEINTTGNLDDALDPNEALVCTATYNVTQADLDLGTITNNATVSVNGIASNQVTTTLSTTAPAVMSLTKSANPVTYDRLGQEITYTYVIMNTSLATLGPAQFIVTDTGLGAPINCGDPALLLASSETVTCSATYAITQADMDIGFVATDATASAEGVPSSLPANAMVSLDTTTPTTPGLTPGSTIEHKVEAGEWLWQIARCYGADPIKVRQANTQLSNPALIFAGTTLTIPNIGSEGTIYGPPCVGTHTVQSEDTWDTIGQTYKADVTVLKLANERTMTVGNKLVIPLNSAK